MIILTTLALLFIGLVFSFSTGAIQAIRLNKPEYYFFQKQFIASVIGFIFIITAYKIPLDFYRKLVVPLYFLTIIALLSVFAFHALNGAHRWIILPGINFQPSEMAKFTAILYLAHYLEKKNEKMSQFVKGFLPATMMLGFMAALILLEPDLGTTVLIIFVSIFMFFVGGASLLHLFGSITLLLPVIIAAIGMNSYRKERIIAFMDPWAHYRDSGYQLIQSLTAIGSGGFFGKGFGESSQKLFFLPDAHTDFVFAIISEEFGFIGAAIVIGLTIYLFSLGIKVALKHDDRFKRIFTFGLSLIMLMQAIFHICVTVGLFPTKGITLPFVSYGGSALIFHMFSIGVILRSAKEVE
jgi:cell division protein FtsW